MKKALLLLAVLALTLSLTACGDSGSDDDPQPSVVKKVTGCVSGAPVKGAKVFAKSSCLLEEVRKGKDGNKDLLVGVTDKDGCIIFDQDALCKLDRTKNIFLYSKGGMRFNCEYDCEEDANLKGGVDKKCYFRGQLRAILAPGAWCVNLTLPNTIAHDLVVDCDKSLEEANNLVKKLICCWMSIKLMEDPLGNACCDIVNYEYIAQALLLGMGSNEDGLANNTHEYREALARTVRNLCYWTCRTQGRLDEFRTVARQIERVKAAMLPVLGEAYRTEIQCLTREDILSDKVYTTALGKKCDKSVICNIFGKDCCYIPYRYYPPYFKFTVFSCSNKERCNGKFTICELPDCGELYYDGHKRVSVGDKFEGNVEFTFKITREEYRNLRGKKVYFKFQACDGCYVPELVVCGKYLGERDIAVSSFKHLRAEGRKFDLYHAEPVGDGTTLDLNEPGKIKVVGDGYARLAGDDLAELLHFDVEAVGVVEKGQRVRAEIAAPAGFVFAYAEGVTEEYKAIRTIAEDGSKLIASKDITEETKAEVFKDLVLFKSEDKLELRTVEKELEIRRSHMKADIFVDEELVGRCGYDEEDEENESGCDFYVVDTAADDIPLAANVPEEQKVEFEVEGATLGTAEAPCELSVEIDSWNTRSGKDECPLEAPKWKAVLVDAPETVGFNLAEDNTTAKEMPLSVESDAKFKGAMAKKLLKATFAGQEFTWGDATSVKMMLQYGADDAYNAKSSRPFTFKKKAVTPPEE